MPNIIVKVSTKAFGPNLTKELKKREEIIKQRFAIEARGIIRRSVDFMEKAIQKTAGWSYLTHVQGRAELGFDASFTNPHEVLLEVLRQDALKFSKPNRKGGLVFQWGFVDSMIKNRRLFHNLTKVVDGVPRRRKSINWFDWLENGVSIARYNLTFDRSFQKFSRSGLGIMRKSKGTSFEIFPHKIIVGSQAIIGDDLTNFIQKESERILNKLARIYFKV